MYFPLLGRVRISDWPFILLSLLLAWAEFIVSAITFILPLFIIDLCTKTTKLIYGFTSNPINLIKGNEQADESKYLYNAHPEISKEKYQLMIDLLNADNIQEMCRLFGYDVENRVVRTKDDYLLTIQRITDLVPTSLNTASMNKGSERSAGDITDIDGDFHPHWTDETGTPSSSYRMNHRAPPRVPNGKVIYLHHGLLMSSEVWVTMIEKYQNLPFILYDLGYDVWLGNNRGNKYSQKHLFHKPQSEKFWDFSMDEFALFDIPNTIDYILSITNKPKLTYIGFSQGTAQAFASVSVNPDLNQKVERIIAISPATTPRGLYSRILDILLKSSPSIMFLLFSRKVLMPSVFFWKSVMYPPLFDTLIDLSNYMLFNWKSRNITKFQKLSSYAHLYSTTSVKTVVHWFQIISSKNFQMYHDSNFKLSGLNPLSYPLKNIEVPINLIYGTIDSLVDIDLMLSQLPDATTKAQPVENHEHLDNLWGDDVFENVFSHVLSYLGEDLVETRLIRNEPHESKLIEDILPADNTDEEVTLNNQSLRSYLKNDRESHTISVTPVNVTAPSGRNPSSGGSVFL